MAISLIPRQEKAYKKNHGINQRRKKKLKSKLKPHSLNDHYPSKHQLPNSEVDSTKTSIQKNTNFKIDNRNPRALNSKKRNKIKT